MNGKKKTVEISAESLQSRESVLALLKTLAEPAYGDFSGKLIPGFPRERILGVRLPLLRKIAVRMAAGDWEKSVVLLEDSCLEEVMLQGMIIGYGTKKLEFDRIRKWTDWFLPRITTWSVCDSFCSTLKAARRYPEEMWQYLLHCLESPQTYVIRFGAVMMLDYFTDREHLHQALAALEQVRHPDYYVQMAVAWAVSAYYAAFPEETEAFLAGCRLDGFTYRKTIQKICESRRTDSASRKRIRQLRPQSGEV